MSSDLSTYLGNKVLRWLLGNAMPTAPTSLYAALFNGDPKAAGSEVTTTIRVAGRVTIPMATLASGTGNTVASNADADFGTAAGGATVTHVAVYDAASAGNLLGSKALASSQSVLTGAPVKILSGDISFTCGS